MPHRLPEHPNLEQLRKQAKDLLAAFRAGDADAVAEVQRFERKPDAAAFALAGAQRVLARSYGFDSWPKLKAFVDGVTIARFGEAAKAGDVALVRSMLAARPELAGMDMSEGDEHRALHYAVLRRDPALVRVLMQAGADARKGIWPHREPTSALTLAKDREYDDIVAVIEAEEQRRRREMSCPNATISPVQDQISAAISGGDTGGAMRLLEAEPSLMHACDRNGATALHIAADAGDAALAEWLVEHGASVRKKDLHGLTPLDRAALEAATFPAIAKLLLDHGAELTVRAAVALGDGPRVREFVRQQPELLREIDHSGGFLTLAVNHGQLEMVRLLLDLGADVDERILLEQLEEPVSSWGMPLWHAARNGDLEITRLLLDRGADPNANVYASGWPLRNAWKHEAVRHLLLERGAKPQPYMVAEFHDVAEARRLLTEAPTDELARELASSAGDHGCPEILELALPHVKLPPHDPGWHWIMIQPVRGSDGSEGFFQCLETLLRYGVDPNVRRFGATVLHFTAAHHSKLPDEDRARFAALLIDHGARLNLRDDLLKSTPLGWACRWGRVKMAEVLIQRGAPVEEADAEAWATPRAWARKMARQDVLHLL